MRLVNSRRAAASSGRVSRMINRQPSGLVDVDRRLLKGIGLQGNEDTSRNSRGEGPHSTCSQ